jgi:sugar/nucleoside kinase (ribokinase family)
MKRVFVGFDGFIDTLLECVDVRNSDGSYKKIPTLKQFAARIAKASKKNANVECVVKESCLGGNAPLCAQALANLGLEVHLAGCCGYPKLHPIFSPLQNQSFITSLSNPGKTDALEFDDGKLMLGKMGELSQITFEQAAARLPAGYFLREVQQADVIVTVNWTMMPLVEEFWQWLFLYPNLIEGKILFVDLADPAKRPPSEIQAALRLLKHLAASCSVILGVNASEAEQLLSLCGHKKPAKLQQTAEQLVTTLNISTLLLHTQKEVVAATASESVRCKVPVCTTPLRSTGAGDVCNAGFIAATVQQLPLRDCVSSAIGAAGIWVRTGRAPTKETLQSFLTSHAL